MSRMKLAGGIVATLATLILSGVASDTAGAQAAPSDRFRVAPGVFLESQGSEGLGSRRGSVSRQRQSTAHPSIVGGDQTTIQKWPWQVGLTLSPELYFGNAFDRQFCGGSLVAPTIVITAAHCFFDEETQTFNFVDEVAVVTGRTRLSSSEGAEIPLEDYYFFVNREGTELYDWDTSEWDVVILQLASPSASPTIKVAGPDERDLWTPGRRAYVTGWGVTQEDGFNSDLLRQAEIEVIGESTCGSSDSYGALFIAETMLCAGLLEGGRDSCQGDSGGPLVVPTAGGRFRLIGDNSWGNGCARPGFPGVYGRLAANPIRESLKEGVLSIAGVNVVGSGASPPTDKACEKAKKKLKKAKKKLKKAKKSGKPEKIKKAKKKLKKAKKQKKKAC